MKNLTTAGLSIVLLITATTIFVWTASAPKSLAHCQVPCGIYDDAARISQLREDLVTIDKAIHSINGLTGKHDAQSANQLVRWIKTKEDHASHIMTVMSEYFLAQRVSPVSPSDGQRDAYLQKLADHHAVLVAAMKAKQHSSPDVVAALNRTIDSIAKYY